MYGTGLTARRSPTARVPVATQVEQLSKGRTEVLLPMDTSVKPVELSVPMVPQLVNAARVVLSRKVLTAEFTRMVRLVHGAQLLDLTARLPGVAKPAAR
jgi:hypothetical protein